MPTESTVAGWSTFHVFLIPLPGLRRFESYCQILTDLCVQGCSELQPFDRARHKTSWSFLPLRSCVYKTGSGLFERTDHRNLSVSKCTYCREARMVFNQSEMASDQVIG